MIISPVEGAKWSQGTSDVGGSIPLPTRLEVLTVVAPRRSPGLPNTTYSEMIRTQVPHITGGGRTECLLLRWDTS